MNALLGLFTPREHMIFEAIVADARKGALMMPLLALAFALSALLLLCVAIIDWEIYYRIFEYLSGEDGYWSPALMACTGIVMIIAFHLLAKARPDHPLVRLVTWLSAFIIVAFIVGGGLYIAVMLYNDGMGDLPGGDIPLMIGAVSQSVAEQGWIDGLFEHVTSPGAVLSLSLGIGGLSIVAMYIAHRLLGVMNTALSEIYTRGQNLRDILAHHRAIKQAETELAELHARDDELSCQDETFWKLEIASAVLEVIVDRLGPHERLQQKRDYKDPENRWEQEDAGEQKRAAGAIKKIRSLTLDDILKAMSPPKQLRKPQ